MSYDIDLTDPVTGETLELDAPHHMRGGTYAVGGTTSASLNVTYNYAPHFWRVLPTMDKAHPRAPAWMHDGYNGQVGGIRSIYGLTGAESLPVLDAAIAALGNDVSENYWDATEGNAKRALVQLRTLAAMRPDGIWTGD